MQNDSTTLDFGDLTALLPFDVDGYRSNGQDKLYEPDALFELLNGGAEVYRSLNVRAVVSRSYAKAGAPEVLVDVFDMGSSRDAYGAYHHDMREGPNAGIGHESELGGCSLFFWKHRYFVSVVAVADTSQSRNHVVSIASAVATRISGNGEIPDIARLIPRHGLVASQVHYFHTWPLLNRHYRFASEDLLELAADTEGILAHYQYTDATGASSMPALLLARYPSAERADKARQRFVAGFLSGRDAEITLVDASWIGFVRCDNLLVGVFDAASHDQVRGLLDAVERNRKS